MDLLNDFPGILVGQITQRRHVVGFLTRFVVASRTNRVEVALAAGGVTVRFFRFTVNHGVDIELAPGYEICQIGKVLIAHLARITMSRVLHRRDNLGVRSAGHVF